MTATAPTPRDLLVEARTLIASPEAWTQGAAARDADGEPVGVEHEDAVTWCATGALNCAMYRHVDSLEVPPPLQRARDQAGTILTDTVRALTLGHYTEATTYNDQPITAASSMPSTSRSPTPTGFAAVARAAAPEARSTH